MNFHYTEVSHWSLLSVLVVLVMYCKRRYILITALHLNLNQYIPDLRPGFRKKVLLPSFFCVGMKKKEAERDLHLPSKRPFYFLKKEGLENITQTQEALQTTEKAHLFQINTCYSLYQHTIVKTVEQNLHCELLQPQMLCTSATSPPSAFCT